MKNNEQETIDSNTNHKESSKEQVVAVESFESRYIKEHKKSQTLLISTAVFGALFLIAVSFGLRAAGQDDRGRGAMRPGGMMRSDYDDRQAPGRQYYR